MHNLPVQPPQDEIEARSIISSSDATAKQSNLWRENSADVGMKSPKDHRNLESRSYRMNVDGNNRTNQIVSHFIGMIRDKQQSDQLSFVGAWFAVWSWFEGNKRAFFIVTRALEDAFSMESHEASRLADLLADCNETDLAAIESSLLRHGREMTATANLDDFKNVLIERLNLPQQFYQRPLTMQEPGPRMIEIEDGSTRDASTLAPGSSPPPAGPNTSTRASRILNEDANFDDPEYRNLAHQPLVNSLPSSVGATGGTTRSTRMLNTDTSENVGSGEIVGISEDDVSSNAGGGGGCGRNHDSSVAHSSVGLDRHTQPSENISREHDCCAIL